MAKLRQLLAAANAQQKIDENAMPLHVNIHNESCLYQDNVEYTSRASEMLKGELSDPRTKAPVAYFGKHTLLRFFQEVRDVLCFFPSILFTLK